MEQYFSNPKQWKKVLFNLYAGRLLLHKEYNHLQGIPPATDINMEKEFFDRALHFLKENDLVEIRDDDFYYLTLKGFDVAFELEKQIREIKEKKRFEIGQYSILFFTFVLTITGVITLAKEVYPLLQKIFFWMYSLSIVGISIFITRKLRKIYI